MRITSSYGSHPSSVVLACKTANFGQELQVSIGTRPHLSFCACKSAPEGSQTSPVVLCIQNSVLSIRIHSLYGSKPSSAVFASKTAPFGPELKVSMGPSPRLWFNKQNIEFRTITTSVYGSLTSFVMWLAPEFPVSIGPSPHLWFLNAKQGP